MVGRYYNTGINVDIDNLYLLCFYGPIWFVKPFKWICGQAFLEKLPYECLAFTNLM